MLHHRKGPEAADANATLMLQAPFLKMMMGSVKLKDLLPGDELKTGGSKVDLARFIGRFDKAKGVFPIVTPLTVCDRQRRFYTASPNRSQAASAASFSRYALRAAAACSSRAR